MISQYYFTNHENNLKCKVKDVKNLSQKNFQALDHFVLDIFCGSQIHIFW